MSRVGKTPVDIPEKVEIKIDGNLVTVKGPRGELKQEIPSAIEAKVKDNEVIFTPVKKKKNISALWGLARSLVNNMVEGVTEGFEKTLEIRGREYKVSMKGKSLNLDLGYSHPIVVEPKEDIEFEIRENNYIVVKGIDKQMVGEQAAEIRELRPPEVYKGKGIRYKGEYVIKKEGKKGL